MAVAAVSSVVDTKQLADIRVQCRAYYGKHRSIVPSSHDPAGHVIDTSFPSQSSPTGTSPLSGAIMSSTPSEESSLLDSTTLAKFDAFPKLPSTYRARSESRGFMTLFVAFLAFMLVVNDIGEYIWGWPDFEFSVDTNPSKYLNINLDLVVAMPCGFISVDLRDAMGDRLLLTGGFRRDGVVFDIGQATALKEHAEALSSRQAIAQSRKSRGLFDWLYRREKSLFTPAYDYKPGESACRISGTLAVKRVTANLHITTLGHGYASFSHVDHSKMNLSHIITEFSFGPHFPDIVQPLDNSFEATDKHFIAFQYFLHVVPTTYIAPRSWPLRTSQYSVTHYTREVAHDRGTPGIFFKFELDPLHITLHQRTTSFLQLLIRVVGVLGGVFVCMGYAIRITTRAVEVVSGADQTPGIVAAESSGVKVGLKAKWGGSELRSRPGNGKLVPQGGGWVMEGGNSSPYSSYNNTPLLSGFPSSNGLPSPYINSGTSTPSTPQPGTPGSIGLGYPSSPFGPMPSPGGIRASASLGPTPRTPAPVARTTSGSIYSPLAPQSLTPDPNEPIVGSSLASSVTHGAYPNSPNEVAISFFPPPPRPQLTPNHMSVFPAQNHHAQEQPPTGGFTYQTPPTPTLMAVLGPPRQTLTSENALDALERRLLAEVGTRKHPEPWDYNTTHHNHIIITEEEDEESVEENGGTRYGMKTKVFKDHHQQFLGRRDVLLSSSSPVVPGMTGGVANGNQRLPRIDTDLDLDLVRGEGVNSGGSGGGGNGISAPIAIPMKSPDPLNESCISSLTLGGEGLVNGLPDTGGGPSYAAPAAGDSDGEGDGEAEFDGRTHRAGSASISGGSSSGSDGMVVPGFDGGGFHKRMRQRAEVCTPTEMIPQQRDKSRRGGSGGGDGRVETKDRVKSSSSKKKERLTGSGKGTSEPKKSRNKSSAAAKGRVAAWLGCIDPAVPPQEEIIPPSPSVIRDSGRLSFEDEQRGAIGSSPLAAAAPLLPLRPDSDSPTTPGGALVFNARSDFAASGIDNENFMDHDNVLSAYPNPPSSGFAPISILNRNTIPLPSRPLLLGRDTTVIEEARRAQDLWSSTPPGITPLDKDTPKLGATGAMSLLPHEKIIRKPSPSSSFSKPASAIPLSYSAAVTSTPPSALASSSGVTATARNVWKNADLTQSTSQPTKGRHVHSTTKPPAYNPPNGNLLLSMFPPSKTPINPEVKYDIHSASGAINSQRHNHQTAAATTTTVAAAASHSNLKDKGKEVPKRLFNAVEEASDTLPSSSASWKPVKTKKKLFSAAVMTPAPALKNVRTYTSPNVATGSGGGGGSSSSAPKKMASTPALLPVRSVDVLGQKAAAASRSNDNLLADRPTPKATRTSRKMNALQGGKTTPSANLSTSSSGPPGGGKLHELTTTTKRAVVNGPPGVMIKATSDPAVISSSHAVPTLSSSASLVRPHDNQNNSTTGRKQDNSYYRHHLQPRVAVVKLPSTKTLGSAVGVGVGVGARSGSTTPQLGSSQMAVDNNNSVTKNSNSNPRKPAAELAFGQARLRDLIKKYQAPSPGDGGQKT